MQNPVWDVQYSTPQQGHETAKNLGMLVGLKQVSLIITISYGQLRLSLSNVSEYTYKGMCIYASASVCMFGKSTVMTVNPLSQAT